jgi:hypothetical protein
MRQCSGMSLDERPCSSTSQHGAFGPKRCAMTRRATMRPAAFRASKVLGVAGQGKMAAKKRVPGSSVAGGAIVEVRIGGRSKNLIGTERAFAITRPTTWAGDGRPV